MYRHWNTWDDGCYSHIFYSEIKNGKISNGKDIMENEPYDSPLSPYFDAKEIRWSTNGKTIAYTCKKMTPNEYSISTNSDIYLYNVKTEKTEIQMISGSGEVYYKGNQEKIKPEIMGSGKLTKME